MDHYEALGVARGDGADVIRRAYLDLARRYHPDFHAEADESVRAGNARRMQVLNDAWAVLGDPAARSAYDRDLIRMSDPGVARRAAREPATPPGKGWTPRAGDDGWMDDFQSWADDRDDLAPDVPRSTGRRMVTVLPVGLFALSLGLVGLGIVMTARALVAVGVIAFVLSIGMFAFLPVFEMTRGRRSR
ncbi:MAG: cbpA [Acidimicrobiales bacterium]|nr:cbpA [Acidimicrobiales bacterium]